MRNSLYISISETHITDSDVEEGQVTSNTLGKRSRRKDGVDERYEGYKYVKWSKPRPTTRKMHTSHQSASAKRLYVTGQTVPAFCILCPQQRYLYNEKLAIQHYKAVHLKPSVIVQRTRIMMCRCSDVRSRGSDHSCRNSHFHCPCCWKPCDQRYQLGIHMISRHDTREEDVHHLFLTKKKRKQKGRK